ncbi:ovochymase-like [Amphiura filiformis]|uniref:ovochymase-like n=1 Tax=Amphiura filiformis TaxID=82378 RepID=UPI003B22523F
MALEIYIVILIVLGAAPNLYASGLASCETESSLPDGYIISPGYPDRYPDNIDWCVNLTAPSGLQVRLTFHDFYLQISGLCVSDSLVLYDAPRDDSEYYIGTFCGNYISSQMQSTSGNLFLRFTTNSDGIVDYGFNASFEFINESNIPIECGIQTVNLDPEQQIVGGKEAQEGEWPWQAAHLVYDTTSTISEPFIYKYLLGTNNLLEMSGHEQYAEVESVYIHPNYLQSEDDWDLALMKLTHPVLITDYVRTVCIPGADMSSLFDAGTLCTISGWGAISEGGPTSDDLLEVEVPIVDKETCSEIYDPEPITDNMLCAGFPEGGKDSCQGDSGGPMVSLVNNTWYLPGVVSWGYGCARPNIPGVYTRVTAFEDWIKPVFEGGYPEEYVCSYEEFKCLNGWCTDYELKCNSYLDGCSDGSDELYCGNELYYCILFNALPFALAKYFHATNICHLPTDDILAVFDPFPYVRLTPSSVNVSVQVEDENECATLCLTQEDVTCLAFDFQFGAQTMCYLAGNDFQLESTDDVNVVNFQIEKMPPPGSTLTSPSGRFATPKWLSAFSPESIAESFYWIIGSEHTNRVSVGFLTIHKSEEPCSPNATNEVVVRAGTELTSPVRFQRCLNDLNPDDPVVVENSLVRVDFNTIDPNKYGFIAEYTFESAWTCNQELTGQGTINSPNYPDDYPSNVECQYRIKAPTDMSVQLEIQDLEIQPSLESFSSHYFDDKSYYDFPGCPFDYLSVYDGPEADESQFIDVFCGSLDDVPEPIRSSGRYLYLEFKSDELYNYRGFQASFTFVGDTKPEYLFWIYVGAGILGGVLVICIIMACVLCKKHHTKSSTGSFAPSNNKYSDEVHINYAMEVEETPSEVHVNPEMKDEETPEETNSEMKDEETPEETNNDQEDADFVPDFVMQSEML